MKYMLSYAQNAEDVVLRRLFKNQTKGFYVDVGAGYPTINSVTKHFYDNEWRGVNIEPQKDIFGILQQTRQKDININVAIDTKSGQQRMTSYPDRWGLATINQDVKRHHQEIGLRQSEHKVETVPLADLCEQHNVSAIDFLKIDVEGYECQVIQSMDFNRWRPSIIVVEATYPTTSKLFLDTWHEDILSEGYRCVLFDGINNFYIDAQSSFTFDDVLTPANHRDFYIPIEIWKYMSKQSRQKWAEDRLSEGHDISDIEQYEKQREGIQAEYSHMFARSLI